MVSSNGEFPVSSINQHGKLDYFRSAQCRKSVQSGSNSAPGEENIIDQDDYFVIKSTLGNNGLRWGPVATSLEVIPIHRDIEDTLWHWGARN